MNAVAPVSERIFTQAEAERFLRRRQKRRWAACMGCAALITVCVTVGPPVFHHFRTTLWLSALGADVDWDFNEDNWRQGGVTTVWFPVAFRANGQFNNRDVASLRELHRLESLDLSNAFDISALGLADLKGMKDLKVLDLGRVEDKASIVNAPPPKFADGDLVHLRTLTGLRELVLSGNPITDDGLAYLAPLTNLDVLDLEETAVTGAGLHHLKGLTKLKVLHLGKAKGARRVVSPEAAMELNQALPDVVIHLKQEYELE